MSRLYRTHLSMGSNRITDLPEPTTAGEPATKNYVETYTATVSGTVTVDGRKVLDLPNNSTERGPWNPIASFIRGAGRKLWEDEEFASSVNGIAVYNNATNGAVTHTRALHSTFEASVAPPNSSGYSIKISYMNPPGAAAPGLGGFIHDIPAQENHTFVQMFQAKIPTGYTLNLAENSQGTNNTSYWMSDIVGTGKWEWYVRVSHCGDSGSFSGGGHVYITGPDISFNWYLASCSVWDVTNAVKLWHDQNDGAGSGLDADLLDANDSAFYLNSSNQNAGTLPAGRTPAYTGDVSSSAGSLTLTIASNSVTYSKMQDVSAASKLIGRGDSGAGDPQEITLGANLSMTGTTLSATSGSSVTVSDDTTQNVTHYPTFSAATSGTISALEVSSTKLTYNPSTGNLSSTFFVSTATSTFANTTIGSTGIEINANGSGNRNAYIDFHGDDTYTDYGLRIIRSNGGPNTVSQMLHRGTGEFDFFTVDAAAMRFYTTNTERARITPTGNFYVDTNTLYVDAANNRVGIGTASPAYPLDIINASPRMRIGDSGNSGGGVIFGNNAHGVVRAYNGVANDVGLFTTSGDVHLSGNSETTGKLIVKNSGRVLVNTMTDNGTSELQINGGITGDSFATHLPGAGLRLINPAGASRIHAATSETGAIKIKLPISAPGSDSFIKMTVNIYEYAAQRTRTITLAGHPHEGSVQAWANTAAYEVGDSTATTLTARFGCDASNFKCVWLGETNTVWDYLTVWISDVQIGYSNYTVPMWESGWALSVVTSFDTVNHLHTVIRQWNANNDGAGSGLDADLLDGIDSTGFARLGATSNFTTAPTINTNTIWHAGNDGAGSGLDADFLDGQTTTFFTNSDNQSAGTLPAARHPAHTGDVTSPANSVALTIATNIVTNAKLAQMAANTIKGNNTGSTANASDLTTAQTKTLLAISLTSDVSGTLQAAQAPAFTGDVTSSAGSLTLTIASNAVTYAKMQDVSAASTLIGRGDSGAGDPQEITIGSGLSMSGTTLSTTGGGGVTIADDTTTNSTHYPVFSPATSGSQSTLDVSSTKLTFNPSTGTLSATAFNSLSDEKAKTNITPITGAVNTVNQLNGVTFNWKETKNKSSGVIAQEIEKILPFLVCEENGTKSVNYSGIIGYLIEAVKELSAKVEALEEGCQCR